MRSAPCATPRRGRCGRSTTTTTTTTSACACGRASRLSPDPASLDHLKVIPQLLGFPQIVPAEELFHARGNLGNHGLRMIRDFVKQVKPPHEHVLHANRQLTFYGVYDLGPDLGTACDDRVAQPAVAVDQIEHCGGFAAVARDQVSSRGFGGAARARRLAQDLELRGFPAR